MTTASLQIMRTFDPDIGQSQRSIGQDLRKSLRIFNKVKNKMIRETRNHGNFLKPDNHQ